MDRRYETWSGNAPLPLSRDTQVPPVHGHPTDRYARFIAKCMRRDGTLDIEKVNRRETAFFTSKLEHMCDFVLANISMSIRRSFRLFGLTYCLEVCDGVLLNNLRKRRITDVIKEQEQIKYDAMLEANMTPRSTSGVWMDDSGSKQWLVIYAGQHSDGGVICRDGFEVCHSKFSNMLV